MNITLKKAVSDLCCYPGRSLLAVIALVIGLWGIGSILVSYAILKNDLRDNYLQTLPAHVVVVSNDFDRLDLAQFIQRADIETAEFRDLSIERIEVFPNVWVPLLLFGVENFASLNLAKFYAQTGKAVPGNGAMLMERNGQGITDLRVGSVARIAVGAANVIEAPIVGMSFDPGQAPSTMDHLIYGYVDKNTYTNITEKPINQRLIFRLNGVNSQQEVQTFTQKILNDFKQQGIPIKKINLPELNEHPHQFQLNSLLFLQGGIGLLALIMGVVLVSQLMGAMLAQQSRQIGILKAIGASRQQILRIYLLMVLALGVVSSVIAIPLIIVSGYGFALFVAKQLNFEILTTVLPVANYICLIAIGLLLPVVASLPALLKGTAQPVATALNDYGVVLEKTPLVIRTFSYLISLVVNNTLRRKMQLVVTLVTMALGVAIFSTGFNVRESLYLSLHELKDSMKFDVLLTLKASVTLEQALLPFKSLDNIADIQALSGGRGVIQTQQVDTTSETTIIALPHDTDLIQLEVLQGRWLQASNELEMVVNHKVLETFDEPVIGNYYSIAIDQQLVKIKLVGVVKQWALPVIYIDKTKYDNLVNPSHQVMNLMVTAKDSSLDQVVKLTQAIEQAIEQSMLSVASVTSQAEFLKIIYDHLNIILSLLTFLAFLVLLVSALGMAATMSINIMERTREIGILRAIGATPQKIYRLFISEGMVIGVTSLLLGLLLAWPVSIVMADFFGNLILEYPLNYAFSRSGLMITVVVTLVFAWLASRLPATKAVRLSTREALAYE